MGSRDARLVHTVRTVKLGEAVLEMIADASIEKTLGSRRTDTGIKENCLGNDCGLLLGGRVVIFSLR